jgi:hypothetical protein
MNRYSIFSRTGRIPNPTPEKEEAPLVLSEQERRLLDELGRDLTRDDPVLARKLETGKARTPPARIAV